jgi:capsular exopolysaccharide synthesis family protein
MEGRDYLRVLGHRWRSLVAVTLICLGVAAVVTVLTPSRYESTAQAFITIRDPAAGTTAVQAASQVADANQANQLAVERVKSYVDLVTSSTVLQRVIDSLHLSETPAELARQITVTTQPDTVLMNITGAASSALAAQQLTAEVGTAFAQAVTQLESDPGMQPAVRVTFVRQPTAADSPAFPVVPLNLGLGLLAGLLLGVAFAVVREGMNPSLRTAAEIRAVTGQLPLGVIPVDASARSQPVPSRRSARLESYERLRTHLHFVPSPPKALVVAGPTSGTGASLTAANVAISLARIGVRTVLVEADLRRPRLARQLGVDSAIGLSDVLTGRATAAQALRPWGDGSLPVSVMPAGPVPPDPNELLCSAEMMVLISALCEDCDLLVLDAPPLLEVTDAAVLAKVTDGALVVVRAGRTTPAQLERAVSSLVALDAKLHGTVLSAVPTHRWWPHSWWRGRRSAALTPKITHAAPTSEVPVAAEAVREPELVKGSR